MADDDSLIKEYYALLEIVSEQDKNAMTVKGWAVTLSLAAIGLGFQFQHYGFFLLASVSAVGFWIIDGHLKRSQMRYRFRMRDIECLRNKANSVSPLIEWTYSQAHYYLAGKQKGDLQAPVQYTHSTAYDYSWIRYYVAFPHAISVFLGAVLFVLGLLGVIRMPF